MIERDDYISICIPAFNRYGYLKDLIDSIEQNADYPYEIIIHDDNSNDGTRDRIYNELKDRVSTIIFNNNEKGMNVGLSESADRITQLATSKYILFINADCKIVRPCFKEFVDILREKEYVGWITPVQSCRQTDKWFQTSNSTKFVLSHGIGAGCCIVTRKDVWEKVGGFSGKKGMWNGGSDTYYIHALYQQGYFKAEIIGNAPVHNVSQNEKGNQDTTIRGNVRDCCLPRVFKFESIGKNYDRECAIRYAEIDSRGHKEEKQDAGRSNMPYWHRITFDTVHTVSVDWDKLCGYRENFRQFKKQIDSEVVYSE